MKLLGVSLERINGRTPNCFHDISKILSSVYVSRMKGSSNGLRGTQLSLIFIVLMCTTIFFWAWEKSPLLTSLLPPQGRSLQLQLSSDVLIRAPVLNTVSSKPQIYASRDKPIFTGKDTASHQEQKPAVIAPPVDFAESSLIMNMISNNSATTPAKEKAACNYAKGKWVVDNNRPLYSGFNCKQWLSDMWSCRLTQRMDFSYEKLRWQPKDCEMEEFEGYKFLKRMQGKTLAFVGDSLGRQQFQSLMCMLTGGKEMHDVIDVGKEFGLSKPRGARRPDGWAYRFTTTKTTILYYWSACLCDLQPVDTKNPKTEYAMHLDRPPAFLRRYLHKINFLVLNTGHHWNRGKFRANRWVMYVGGTPDTTRKLVPLASAKNFTIHSTVQWVDSQLGKHPDLKVLYRSISPRHFVNGDWNTGGSCNNTTPMSIGKELLQDKSSDVSAANAVKGTRVKLLDITALSNLRDEGHMSRFSRKGTPGVQDCLHWCLPGVPDTWNEILLAQL